MLFQKWALQGYADTLRESILQIEILGNGPGFANFSEIWQN